MQWGAHAEYILYAYPLLSNKQEIGASLMNKRKKHPIYGMNLELTTACPLRCPQCYCSLEGGKHLPLQIALHYLEQAKELGVKHVELSGGETLCYPHLAELIQKANALGIETNIAISGWKFNMEVLDQLRKAGLSRIFVSLNGPTKELNARSRDGFQYAISALEVLKESDFSEVYINWVMHRDTSDYLPEMIQLAQEYDVKAIVIMSPKPTSRHELDTVPTKEQMERVAHLVKTTRKGFLLVESCFSPLLAMVSESKFLGNLNIGIFKGCGAGWRTLSVSVDGMVSPCRHLEYYEKWDRLEDYLENSPVLRTIRDLELTKEEPCTSCQYGPYCRHCLAINVKIKHRLFLGNSLCPVPID